MSSLDPKAGGPREGVCRRGVFLEKQGHSVSIVTLDAPTELFLKDIPLTVYALGPSYGVYRYNPRLMSWLMANASGYDGVVVNGLWQYHGFATRRALRRLGLPYYVFAHGMLDPWFKHAYPMKHLKKWLYWPWGEYQVLRDARMVMFTSEEERRLASQSFWLYRAQERVVAYGTSPPPIDSDKYREGFLAAYPELRDSRILLFLGRLHEKKGCDLLIEAFAKVAASYPKLRLVMAGPGSSTLVARLKDQALNLDISDRVSWLGLLQGEMKWGAFYSADVFVLPSHQENFGIAVAESLGCGLPVLISDKVNIWREIVTDKAGLVDEDTLAGTNTLLRRWLESDDESKAEMRVNAKRSFEARFRVEAMAYDLLKAIGGAAA